MNGIRVDAATLRAHWYSDDAVGMVNDLQRGVRVVEMTDGTQYETPLSELEESR